MARIKTYALDSEINPQDKLIGSDGQPGDNFGKTKNYTIQSLQTFIGTDLVNKNITLTAAQILSLNGGNSIDIIPAPGAGKMIFVMNALIHLDFNTTAYNFAIPAGSLTDGVGLRYGTMDVPNDNALFTQNLNSGVDTFFIGDPLGSTSASYPTNVALNIYSTSGVTVSQGDSLVKMSILYREILIP